MANMNSRTSVLLFPLTPEISHERRILPFELLPIFTPKSDKIVLCLDLLKKKVALKTAFFYAYASRDACLTKHD